VVAPVIEPRSAPVKPEPAKPAIEWPTRVASREAASEPKPVDPPKAVAPEPVRLERPVIAVVEPVAPVAVAPVVAVPAAPAVVAAPAPPPAPVAPLEPVPAPVQAPPVWAKPGSQPSGARPHFFAQATKGTSPVEAPAMVAAVAAAAEPATQPAASKVGL